MSSIEKKFGQRSDQGLELERLRTEELAAQWDDISVEVEKYGSEDANPSPEAIAAYLSRSGPDTLRLAFRAIKDSKRKLRLLQTSKEMLDEQAAHIERLEATLKAHGLDVDR